jgi:hypothetical protein
MPSHRSQPHTAFTWAALLLVIVASGALPAQAGGVAGTWQGVGLAQLAESLTDMLGRPLVLDCRIDPTTPITLNGSGLEAEQLLAALAERSRAEVVILRESVRLAPPGRRAALQAAEEARAAEIAKAPARLRRPLAERQAAAWPAGTTPRELVSQLAADAAAPLAGLDSIPHDHLRGFSGPPMSRGAILDLVLAGYDLRAAVTESGLEIVRLDPKAEPATPPRLDPPAKPPAEAMADAANTRFTLEAAAPLDQLLAAIAAQTGLTLEIDEESLNRRGIDPRRVVRVQVEKATREQLLDAITEPLGLAWTITDTKLTISAGSSPPAAGPEASEPRPD